MIGSIAAPGDLFLDRNSFHRAMRRELIAGMQDVIVVSAFDDTSPSMTETRVPFAPRFTEKKVPVTATRESPVATYRCPVRRLAACTMIGAALKMDRRVSTCGGHRELGPLPHFDHRAVHQLDGRVRRPRQSEEIFAIASSIPAETGCSMPSCSR